jgi:hypothetical protein
MLRAVADKLGVSVESLKGSIRSGSTRVGHSSTVTERTFNLDTMRDMLPLPRGGGWAARYPALMRLYYLAGTPFFWFADVVWDAPARVSFIADPALRRLYYVGCILCGVVSLTKPRLAWRIGLSEGVVNFTLVLLSIMTPIYAAQDELIAGGQPSLDPMQPINAGLSGAVILYGFYSRLYGGSGSSPT